MRRITRLLTTTALSAALALAPAVAPGPARAQVPTTDAGSISEIINTISTIQQQINQMTQMLQYAEQTVNQLTSLNGILGAVGASGSNIGGGDVGGLMTAARLGFSTFRSAQNLVSVASNFPGDIASIASGNLSMMQGFATQQSLEARLSSADPRLAAGIGIYRQIVGGGMTAQDAMSGLANNMYVNGTYTPQPGMVDTVNSFRRLLMQRTALSGMTASMQFRQQLGQNGYQDVQTLGAGVANATNERGDLQVQSAIMLKILETLLAGNAMMSQQLTLEAVTAIGQDSVRGPDVQAPQAAADVR